MEKQRVEKKTSLKAKVQNAGIRGYYRVMRLFAAKKWQRAYIDYMENFLLSGEYYRTQRKLYRLLSANRPDIAHSRIKWMWVRIRTAMLALLIGERADNFWSMDNPGNTLRQLWGGISSSRFSFAKDVLNSPDKKHLLRNKAEFADYLREFFCRGFCQTDKVTEAEFCDMFRTSPRLIVKPVMGMMGRDIRIYDVHDNLKELYRQITALGPSIAEEYVFQSGILHEINPSSLNTIRVITLRDGESITPLCAMVRFGREGSAVDNLHSGGVAAVVELSDGRTADGFTMTRNHLAVHPDSGKKISGITIPRWKEVLDFCVRAHRKMPDGLNLIGWDVCVDDTQLMLIEGNGDPGFAPYLKGNPNCWKLFKQYFSERERKSADAGQSAWYGD